MMAVSISLRMKDWHSRCWTVPEDSYRELC